LDSLLRGYHERGFSDPRLTGQTLVGGTLHDAGNDSTQFTVQSPLSNGKELRAEYAQSNTTILTSIINIMRVPTTTCFGPTRGPSSGCKLRP